MRKADTRNLEKGEHLRFQKVGLVSNPSEENS
jgi:hypothetical protein